MSEKRTNFQQKTRVLNKLFSSGVKTKKTYRNSPLKTSLR